MLALLVGGLVGHGVHQKKDACAAKGGVLAKTVDGWGCMKELR